MPTAVLPLAIAMRRHRVEVAIASALVVGAVLAVGPRPLLLGLVWLAVVTPRLIAVDIAEHRLPDAIVLPGYPVALGAVALDAVLNGGDAATALAAGAVYGGVLLLALVFGGMGLGDVKLAGVLGLLTGALGASTALAAPLVAFLAGGVVATVALVRSGAGARIPFGPMMLLGAWTAVLLTP